MSVDIIKTNDEKINTSNKLPVSFFELINHIKKEVVSIKGSDKFIIKSSGLIVNREGVGCKGYCIGDNEIPNICGKGEQCLNFGRAHLILKNISEFKNEQTLKNIY